MDPAIQLSPSAELRLGHHRICPPVKTAKLRLGQESCPPAETTSRARIGPPLPQSPVSQQSPPSELRLSHNRILPSSRTHQPSSDWITTEYCPPAEPTSRALIEPPQNPVLQQSPLDWAITKSCPPAEPISQAQVLYLQILPHKLTYS